MSIFNDAGGKGEGAAGTYMVVFKRIDAESLKCVPVNFSSREKNAIKNYVAKFQELDENA